MLFDLTPEQKLLQDATRRFAAERIAPGAKERERREQIERELISEMAEQGLLGVNVPSELGGAEAGAVAYAVALREVAAADAAVAVTLAVTNMVAEVITRFGSDEQRRRYVPKLTSGEYFAGAFALSEPGAGSDAGALQTRAVKKGDGWSLSGEKLWISTGDQAGVIVVWARTGGEGPKGISCFLVEGGAKGLSAGKPEHKMGLRASHTVPLVLTDVEVPAGALLGELNQGFPIAMMALDGGRIGIGSQALGIGNAALSEARRYALERQQFGKPIADNQAVSFKLADMATELDAAWLLTLRAAWLKQSGKRFSREAAMAKVFASEAANRAVREAVQIFGGYGYMEDSLVARLYRDCRVTQIYEGTSEVQRLVIARDVLKEASHRSQDSR
jgi:alkylation response protein AidB-like acyl-CoA dehydrogenase